MTVPRYIATLTVVYVLAFLAVLVAIDGTDALTLNYLLHVWPLWLGALAMAALGTLALIARFGAAGGSLYVLPTAVHVTVLVVMAFAIARTAR